MTVHVLYLVWLSKLSYQCIEITGTLGCPRWIPVARYLFHCTRYAMNNKQETTNNNINSITSILHLNITDTSLTTMKLSLLYSILSFLMFSSTSQGQKEGVPVPNIDSEAFVKQRRAAGAAGDLVAGEEDLRKISVQWEPIIGAYEYQVCINCDLEADPSTWAIKTVPVGRAGEKGGRLRRPVLIYPGVPIGHITFHVRVSLTDKEEFGHWSEPRHFNVGEAGRTLHEEM